MDKKFQEDLDKWVEEALNKPNTKNKFTIEDIYNVQEVFVQQYKKEVIEQLIKKNTIDKNGKWHKYFLNILDKLLVYKLDEDDNKVIDRDWILDNYKPQDIILDSLSTYPDESEDELYNIIVKCAGLDNTLSPKELKIRNILHSLQQNGTITASALLATADAPEESAVLCYLNITLVVIRSCASIIKLVDKEVELSEQVYKLIERNIIRHSEIALKLFYKQFKSLSPEYMVHLMLDSNLAEQVDVDKFFKDFSDDLSGDTDEE